MFSYFAKPRRFTWWLRICYSLHANFRANKLQANFLAPKCRKLQYFTAVSMHHMTKSFGTFGHAFGGLSKRFFVSSDYKKISFLASRKNIYFL